MKTKTCLVCLEDVEPVEEPIDDPQYNYKIRCPNSGCGYEMKVNDIPSTATFHYAKEYAILETGGLEELNLKDGTADGVLRAFHHIDKFGVPGGTIELYFGVDHFGCQFWVVSSPRMTNVYRPDFSPHLEEIVQAHSDSKRSLLDGAQ